MPMFRYTLHSNNQKLENFKTKIKKNYFVSRRFPSQKQNKEKNYRFDRTRNDIT